MNDTTENKIDWLNWMCTRLAVVNKASKLVSFVPNKIQCTILGQMRRQWYAGYPVRIIILKARQEGASTVIQGFFYALALNRPHVSALVSAHDAVASQTVFKKAKCFHSHIPVQEQKPTIYNNAYEIQWTEPHGSLFKVQVAGQNLGRSGTFQLFHASELAFWEQDKDAFQSAIDTVPEGEIATIVAIESTANGDSGEFHDRWKQAEQHEQDQPDNLNRYIPIFFSWMDCPDYSMAVPRAGLGKLDEEEEFLLREKGATLEQIVWRRYMITHKYAGDIDGFHQNYPSSSDEAFLTTGSNAIPLAIRQEHHRTAKEPRYARLEWRSLRNGDVVMVECDRDDRGCWRIWEEPQAMHEYAIGGDVAEGIPCDPNNARSDTDRSAMVVLERSVLHTSAMYVGRPEPDVFGEEMVKAGRYFNNAWICPEVNSAGQSTLDTIRAMNYANLYRRHRNLDDIKQVERNQLGWRTTSTTRDFLIDQYLADCRPDPDPRVGYRERIKCFSEELADEEDTFIRTKTGKREHRAGSLDDIFFAAMIAAEVHRKCPRQYAWDSINVTTTEARLGPEFVGGYPRPRTESVGVLETT